MIMNYVQMFVAFYNMAYARAFPSPSGRQIGHHGTTPGV